MATPCCVRLNVGGKLFLTTADTLRSLPDTTLGRLASDDSLTDQPDVELFFDRNPKIINSLLDLYRTGELHLPKNLCAKTVQQELEFWGIPTELVRECCFRGLQECKEEVEKIAEIDRFLEFPFGTADGYKKLSWSGKIWLTMERPTLSLASKIWAVIYFMAVAFSTLLFCMQSNIGSRDLKPSFKEDLVRKNISLKEALSAMAMTQRFFVSLPIPWITPWNASLFLFFLLEFLVRFLTCPVKGFFVRQARNWMDAFLLLQHALGFTLDQFYTADRAYFSQAATDALVFFYALMALRMLRILYAVKDFDMMKNVVTLYFPSGLGVAWLVKGSNSILLLSAKASLKELMLLAVCLLSLAIVFGTALYMVELVMEEFTFRTIPHAMWYAVVTMTTVGYGDVVPLTSVGQILGTLCAFSGLVTIALPIAVVASNFSRYYDNLASRTHLQNRLALLKKRPELLPRLRTKEEGRGSTLMNRPCCYYKLQPRTG